MVAFLLMALVACSHASSILLTLFSVASLSQGGLHEGKRTAKGEE